MGNIGAMREKKEYGEIEINGGERKTM